jgi:tagaturonate reductase
MDDPFVLSLMKRIIYDEIIPSLDIAHDAAREFADDVLERFRNSFIQHPLINITLQSTSKMRERVIPSMKRYFEKTGKVPRSLAFGFSAYLWFMRGVARKEGTIYGRREDEEYPIEDNEAEYFFLRWAKCQAREEVSICDFVTAVCRTDQSSVRWGWHFPDDFVRRISKDLFLIANRGMKEALGKHLAAI